MATVIGAKKIEVEIAHEDIDSLSVLPLGMLPIQSESLRSVRMIKDSKLESAIEMFAGGTAGSGLIYPAALRDTFPKISDEDHGMITAVADLHSFDVYSLRISLRSIGIEVDSYDHLCLSDDKQIELRSYVRPFTERLIKKIYGGGHNTEDDNVIAIFRDADERAARTTLQGMAGNLSIPLHQVPQFIQDYGDIYLSVAYYQNCLDSIQPMIDDFLVSTNEITNHSQMKQNPEVMKVCHRLDAKFRRLKNTLVGRFALFANSSDDMWQNMSAERFTEFRHLMEDNHAILGGVLCTLTVKMNLWNTKFPNGYESDASRRAEFIMTEMRQGL